MAVKGRDLSDGLPKVDTVSSVEVREALDPIFLGIEDMAILPVAPLTRAAALFEKVPPIHHVLSPRSCAASMRSAPP